MWTYCLIGYRVSGVINSFGNRLWKWLHDIVNVINDTELYTLKTVKMAYVVIYFTAIKNTGTPINFNRSE